MEDSDSLKLVKTAKIALRDAHGRLLPGSNNNPAGNPFATLQKKNRMAILHAVTPDVAKQLVLDLVGIAGDTSHKARDRIAATELILRYAAGQPTPKLDVSVTTTQTPLIPCDLSPQDVAALEAIRAKLQATASPTEPEIVIEST